MKIIFISLMTTVISIIVAIISNRFSKKKVVLNKSYAIKVMLLFLISVAILFILESL